MEHPHVHPRRLRWQWYVAYLLGALAIALPVYALWPVSVTTFPDQPPVRVSPVEVGPGGIVQWVRAGTTCFPDEWVLVRQTVVTQLPDGSPFEYPDVGPRFNRQGACVTDNLVAWEVPRNMIIPGPFHVHFDFCTNAGQPLRERCSSTQSPEFVMVLDYTPTERNLT